MERCAKLTSDQDKDLQIFLKTKHRVRRAQAILLLDKNVSIAKRVTHKVAEANLVIKVPQEDDYYTVDVSSLNYQQIRQIGAEHVCLEMIKQLGIEQMLKELQFNHKQINTL